MARNYSQVGNGSRGNDVKTLQEMLNQRGYSLDVDGVFGPKTQKAVKEYQTQNGLQVDGIVGKNTWRALSAGPSTYDSAEGGGSQAGAAPSAADMDFSYDDYTESDTVRQAYELLQQQMGNQPGEYQSAWADQINAILGQILNREKFSYDLNSDALYQQYADQYTRQGQMAMMDTMGQAAAMTGGYGNSYAQSVGQQAYQGYLQQLNEVVPQLYQMAYDQYNQEGQNMLNQYSLLAAQDEQDYGRYRDEVGDYYTLLQQAFDRYDTERNFDYSQYADERDFAYGEFSDDRAYDYQEERDQVADDQWQAEYDEAVRQWDQEFEAAYGDTSSGSGSGNGNGGGGGGGDNQSGGGGGNYDQDTADVQQMLKDAGYDIAVDGVWGPKTQAAYDDYYGEGGGSPEGGEPPAGDYGSLTGSRQSEIESWVARALANVHSASFDLNELINATSFLESDEEREYAIEVGRAIAGTHGYGN